MARGNVTAALAQTKADQPAAGPPLLILGLGFLCVVVSLPLVKADGIPPHVVGYLIGSLLPILLVGVVRRLDLERRRNPRYEAKSFVQPALALLMILAMIAALLQIWPIATELAQ